MMHYEVALAMVRNDDPDILDHQVPGLSGGWARSAQPL